MCNIIVGRYSIPHAYEEGEPEVDGEYPWAGWIEPEDKSWILYIQTNGETLGPLTRDKTGTVAA